MSLTNAQKTTLKTHIAANVNTVLYNNVTTAINLVPNNGDGNQLISEWYALNFSPDFWVWRTSVSKAELTQSTSVDATTFNWTGTGFITRTVGEQTAFRELFDGQGFCNPSLPSVRTAFSDIFSGATAPAPANRTHLVTVARRKANNVEKLYAVGTGSTAVPAVMIYEGTISGDDIEAARNYSP